MSTAAGTLANYPLRYAYPYRPYGPYGAPPPVEEEVVDVHDPSPFSEAA